MLDAGGNSLRHSGDKSSMGKRGFELDVGAITASPNSVVVARSGRALSGLSGRCREVARTLQPAAFHVASLAVGKPVKVRLQQGLRHCGSIDGGVCGQAAEAACTRERGRLPRIGCAFETCAMGFSPPDSGAVTSLYCDRLGQIYLHVAHGKFGRNPLCIVDDISHPYGQVGLS